MRSDRCASFRHPRFRELCVDVIAGSVRTVLSRQEGIITEKERPPVAAAVVYSPFDSRGRSRLHRPSFSMDELLARLRAAFRRASAAKDSAPDLIAIGDFRIDLQARSVCVTLSETVKTAKKMIVNATPESVATCLVNKLMRHKANKMTVINPRPSGSSVRPNRRLKGTRNSRAPGSL